jgi:hypothetical protein
VGIPRVLNRCIEETRGEYIYFLGSDDAMAPATLEKEVALLDANPKVGMVYGPAWLMDETGRLTYILRPPFAKKSYIRSGREEIADLLLSNHIIAPTVMAREQCFDACGLFDERLGLYEDWNMWTRILKRWDIGYIHEPLSFYRVHLGDAGSIFKSADPRSLARFRRIHVEQVLKDPEIAHLYKGKRGRIFAHQHRAIAQRAYDAGDPWFARLNAVQTWLADPKGIPGENGRAAARLFAKSFVPGFVLRAGKKLKNRGAAPTPERPSGKPTIEAILSGEAVPQG